LLRACCRQPRPCRVQAQLVLHQTHPSIWFEPIAVPLWGAFKQPPSVGPSRFPRAPLYPAPQPPASAGRPPAAAAPHKEHVRIGQRHPRAAAWQRLLQGTLRVPGALEARGGGHLSDLVSKRLRLLLLQLQHVLAALHDHQAARRQELRGGWGAEQKFRSGGTRRPSCAHTRLQHAGCAVGLGGEQQGARLSLCLPFDAAAPMPLPPGLPWPLAPRVPVPSAPDSLLPQPTLGTSHSAPSRWMWRCPSVTSPNRPPHLALPLSSLRKSAGPPPTPVPVPCSSTRERVCKLDGTLDSPWLRGAPSQLRQAPAQLGLVSVRHQRNLAWSASGTSATWRGQRQAPAQLGVVAHPGSLQD